MTKKIIIAAALLASCIGGTTLPLSLNMIRSHENLFAPDRIEGHPWQTTMLVEHGFKARGYNEAKCRVDVLRIWQPEQRALDMLRGFPERDDIGQVIASIGGLDDDGTRGHYLVNGDLTVDFLVGFAARRWLPYGFFVGATLPVYGAQLKNVVWQEQTRDPQDRIKPYLTNDFFANVRKLGGLGLEGWREVGLGDSVLMLGWLGDFERKEGTLNNVRLQARLGMNLPTGKRQNEDVIFPMAFGYDGSTGIFLGMGLRATLACYLNLGVDVELLHLFGNTRLRRIKTHKDQTELLLLQKERAFKDYGLTQRFNLYAEAYNLGCGLTLSAAYQFLKQGDSTLTLCSNNFSAEVANTAISLQEHEVHSMLFEARYNFACHLDECAPVVPELSLYGKMPFKGLNSVANPSFGVMLALNF